MNAEQNPRSQFGHDVIDAKDKQAKVQSIFTTVSDQYDIMNDMMSLGLHYGWKRQAVSYTKLKKGDFVLDLACGTCDISYYLYERYHTDIDIVAADPNFAMLTRGKRHLLNHGIFENIQFTQHFAEVLPYQDNHFACVVCAFGFRNFTQQSKALEEIARVLKPGGQCVILEFSQPQANILKKLYHGHARYVIPELGRWLTDNPDAYRYLIDSIATHPSQEQVLHMMQHAGFDLCRVTNILSGLVAIHRGYKC